MPVTMTAFIIGALSIIGVPPTCGFFSKWYLIKGGLASQQYLFVAALIFSSLVNVILFFRIIEIGYFEKNKGKTGIKEAPLSLLLPTIVSALLLIGLGLYTKPMVEIIVMNALKPLAYFLSWDLLIT